MFFASRGRKVTGIDFLTEPITLAKQKAAKRRLTVTFLVMDALALKELPEVFDTVIDSGLFHVFGDDDRRRYVEGLASVLKPGGRLFLLCFSDAEPGDQGPRRVSQKEIEDAFAEGWVVESIEPSRYEVRPDPNDSSFADGGPRAVVRGGEAGGVKGATPASSRRLPARRRNTSPDVVGWMKRCVRDRLGVLSDFGPVFVGFWPKIPSLLA